MVARKTTRKPKTTAKPAAKPKAAAKETEFKYGVPELATELGIAEASVRVKLRNEGIDKAGKSYGWNTDKDFKSVVNKLKPKKAA